MRVLLVPWPTYVVVVTLEKHTVDAGCDAGCGCGIDADAGCGFRTSDSDITLYMIHPSKAE